MSNEVGIYVALGIVSIVYAVALNTNVGQRFTTEHTWASVVLGTALVLAALWFVIPRAPWSKVVLAFAVAGSPMVARSLLNKARRRR